MDLSSFNLSFFSGNQIFSGFICVCDFSAHSHKDTINMMGGATAVVTLLEPEDRDRLETERRIRGFTCYTFLTAQKKT